MIEVWHIKQDMPRDQRLALTMPEDDVGDFVALAKQAFEQGWYEQVATVVTDDLEAALRLTDNDRTGSWSMVPDSRVTVVAPLHIVNGETYGRKSSYIGDVFIKDGIKHVVATFGFKAIPD